MGRGTSGYAWYARVRAVVNGVKTRWSDRYGFDLARGSAPVSLSGGAVNPHSGMIRWTPVVGATAYEVLFIYGLDTGRTKLVKTATTASDLREYYTLHNEASTWPDAVTWRVRAVREFDGETLNSTPAVSHGKWSATNVTNEPPLDPGAIDLEGTISQPRVRASPLGRPHASGAPGVARGGREPLARRDEHGLLLDGDAVDPAVDGGRERGVPGRRLRTGSLRRRSRAPVLEGERAGDREGVRSPVRLRADEAGRSLRHEREARVLRPAHRRRVAPRAGRPKVPGAVESEGLPVRSDRFDDRARHAGAPHPLRSQVALPRARDRREHPGQSAGA